MRVAILFVLGLVLTACGQPSGADGEAAGQGPAAGSEAAAPGETTGGETAYVASCVARYVGQNAQAVRWAPDQCAEEWQRVVDAGSMAEAILAAAGGRMPTSGRMGADVEVAVHAASSTVRFGWQETGAFIPYDVVGALAERGAPRSSSISTIASRPPQMPCPSITCPPT